MRAVSEALPSLSGDTFSRSISKTYRQASILFLTRRLPEAFSTLRPLITPSPPDAEGIIKPAPVARASRTTRVKVWSLYLTILNVIVDMHPDEGKDTFGSTEWRGLCAKVREGEVWEEVVQNGFHGVEDDVDAHIIINLATLLLAHARTQAINQKRLEAYLASFSNPRSDIFDNFCPSSTDARSASRYRSPTRGGAGTETPRDLNSHIKILELYTLHVLLRNDEWDYAREFIHASPILDDERREAFLQALESLREDHHAAQQREAEERQRKEELRRQAAKEERRLRQESEEREHRRLEESRARRESNEHDYTGYRSSASSVVGPSKDRSSSRHSMSSRRAPMSPASRAKKPVTVPHSLGTRVSIAMQHMRLLLDQFATSLQSNPMMLMRLLAFIVGLVLMLGQKNIRDRVQRVLGTSWDKLKATAGMGVKVSYI